jgi:hypothetical protein
MKVGVGISLILLSVQLLYIETKVKLIKAYGVSLELCNRPFRRWRTPSWIRMAEVLNERLLHQLRVWPVIWASCAATKSFTAGLKQYLCHFLPQTKHCDVAFRKHTCQWSRQLLLSRDSIVSLAGSDQASCSTCSLCLLQKWHKQLYR